MSERPNSKGNVVSISRKTKNNHWPWDFNAKTHIDRQVSTSIRFIFDLITIMLIDVQELPDCTLLTYMQFYFFYTALLFISDNYFQVTPHALKTQTKTITFPTQLLLCCWQLFFRKIVRWRWDTCRENSNLLDGIHDGCGASERKK